MVVAALNAFSFISGCPFRSMDDSYVNKVPDFISNPMMKRGNWETGYRGLRDFRLSLGDSKESWMTPPLKIKAWFVIVSIPKECVTILNGIASIMVKVLIEAIPLWIVTSLCSSQ